MDYVAWDDRYSVGVAEIDRQHKQLFEVISAFYDSVNDDRRQALGALLDSLVEYSEQHFSTEEHYMERFGFPGTEAHKQEHRRFIEKLRDIKNRFDEGRLVVSFEVTEFLRDWIVDHVSGTDQGYVKCFADNGLR